MSPITKETRDRVREMVREILKNTPAEPEKTERAEESYPKRVIVNSLREKAEREFDRDESSKSLITEVDLRGLEPGSRVRIAENAKFTPLAQDIVSERGLEIIRKRERGETVKIRSAAIGADHGGFPYKEQIKAFLQSSGIQVLDLGTNSTDAVDYPDFAHAVAKAVGDNQAEIGIIIDGAGIGSAMTANKVPGVRAAACYSPQLAKNAREHNGANVLTLGSGQNSFDEVKQIIEAFMTTELTEERHKKRVGKIGTIESRYR